MPMVTASDLPAKAVRALELVWEEGPDFRSESRLTAIWDAIAEQTVDKARA
jgi:hypothetical protein